MKSIRFSFRRAAVLASALLLLSLSFGLTSCKTDDEDNSLVQAYLLTQQSNTSANTNNPSVTLPSTIKGTWKGAYGDTYVITDSSFTNYSTSDTTATPYQTWAVVSYAVDPTDPTVYYIYGKITQLGSSNYGGVEYPATGTVGYYTAAYIKVVDSSTIQLVCAYKTTNCDASLETVKTTFTDTNGYYGIKSNYTRQ